MWDCGCMVVDMTVDVTVPPDSRIKDLLAYGDGWRRWNSLVISCVSTYFHIDGYVDPRIGSEERSKTIDLV